MNDTKGDASNVGSRESLLRSPSERGEAPTSDVNLDAEPLRAFMSVDCTRLAASTTLLAFLNPVLATTHHIRSPRLVRTS